MKKLNLLILLAFFISVLASCAPDSTEIDDQVYTLAVGCDKAVENKIRLTVQFPSYKGGGGDGGTSGMQKGGGGEGDNEEGIVGNTLVETIEASSILEAINLLNTATTRRISFVHIKAIVFSEEMAREGVKDYLEPIARFRESRGIMQVIVCKGTAEDFIKENKSNIGESIAKAMELTAEQAENTGFYSKATFHTFYNACISPYKQPYAIYAAVNDFKNLKPLEDKARSPLKPQYKLEPGEEPRTGNRKLELIGTAVFNGDKMVGTLNSYETRYFLMVTGEYGKGIFTIEDKNRPGAAIPLDVRSGRRPEIKAHFENGIPVINVKLIIEADIGAIQSRIHYEKLSTIDELNKQLKNVIQEGVESTIKKAQTQWNTDIFGFGKKIARSFLTVTEFEQYNWLKHFKDAKINVDVSVNVRRTGVMIDSVPVRYNDNTVLSGGKQ